MATLTTLSLPQDSAAPCSDVSPEPSVGKENSGGKSTLLSIAVCFVRTPTQVSHHGGCCREIKGVQTLGISLWWKRGGSLQEPAQESWQTKFISTKWLCLSSEPSHRYTLTRELGSVYICLIWIFKQGSLHLCPMHRQGPKSQPHSPWRVPSRSRQQLLNSADQCCSRGEVGRASNLQSKTNSPIWSGNLGCGWLELRQQRALPALELLFLLHLGWESNL